MNKYKLALFFMLVALSNASAQMPQVEMADALRENGKIYVVVVIIAIVFIGLAGYLINLDRKISKLEKKD
ncbi:MAG: CcmD family protein [Bacteroidetes bacterium]|nr:MAG: CcmD family protein [Bacteroidota bacterium]